MTAAARADVSSRAAAACQTAGSQAQQPDGWSSGDEDGYETAEETFSQQLLPSAPAAGPAAVGSQAASSSAASASALHTDGVPFRRRRAYNWEGHWREDKEQRNGMIESFEELGYPWWLMKVLRATPGHTWIISDSSDIGHTLCFDT